MDFIDKQQPAFIPKPRYAPYGSSDRYSSSSGGSYQRSYDRYPPRYDRYYKPYDPYYRYNRYYGYVCYLLITITDLFIIYS